MIELLVVLSFIAVLASLLFPSLRTALTAAGRAQCASNLRQLYLANSAYAADYGHYVAAAADIWSGNLHRWHGVRESIGAPFEPQEGPLMPFLGASERIRRCPAFRPSESGFEQGCGGYGYNARGVGSQSYRVGTLQGQQQGLEPDDLHHPQSTVMFTDAAFPRRRKGQRVCIEYSFAESFHHLAYNRPREIGRAYPSIHFRHGGLAGSGWCDGHVTFEDMDHSIGHGGFREEQIGWFGPRDNSLFAPW